MSITAHLLFHYNVMLFADCIFFNVLCFLIYQISEVCAWWSWSRTLLITQWFNLSCQLNMVHRYEWIPGCTHTYYCFKIIYHGFFFLLNSLCFTMKLMLQLLCRESRKTFKYYSLYEMWNPKGRSWATGWCHSCHNWGWAWLFGTQEYSIIWTLKLSTDFPHQQHHNWWSRGQWTKVKEDRKQLQMEEIILRLQAELIDKDSWMLVWGKYKWKTQRERKERKKSNKNKGKQKERDR